MSISAYNNNEYKSENVKFSVKQQLTLSCLFNRQLNVTGKKC